MELSEFLLANPGLSQRYHIYEQQSLSTHFIALWWLNYAHKFSLKDIKKQHNKACFKNYTIRPTCYFLSLFKNILSATKLTADLFGSYSYYLVIFSFLILTRNKTLERAGASPVAPSRELFGLLQSPWVSAQCHVQLWQAWRKEALGGILSSAPPQVGRGGVPPWGDQSFRLLPQNYSSSTAHLLTLAISFLLYWMFVIPHLEEVLTKLGK